MLYDLILIAIIIISVIWGIRAGAAKTLLSAAAFVLSLVLSVFLSQMLSQLIYTAFIEGALENKINSFVTVSPVGEVAFEAAGFLAGLPAILLKSLESFGITSGEIDSLCAQSIKDKGADSIAPTLENTIAPVITGLISVVLAVVLFIILRLILRKLANLVAKVFRLPLIRIPDSLIGALLGLVKGALIAVAVVLLLKLLSPVIPQNWTFFSSESLEKSMLFSFIYNGGLLRSIQNFTYNIR